VSVGKAIAEAVASAEFMNENGLKGMAIFRLPIHLWQGEYAEKGLPVFIGVSRYPRKSGVKINFFSIDGEGRAVLGKSFKYDRLKLAEKVKESLTILRKKTTHSPIPKDDKVSVYEVIKPFTKAEAEELVKQVEEKQKKYPDNYAVNGEELRKIFDKVAGKEGLETYFVNTGIIPRIDIDGDRPAMQYVYVAVNNDGKGYFRSSLSTNPENEQFYRTLVKTEPPITGVLSNRAGGIILADGQMMNIVRQIKAYEEISPSPAQLEVMEKLQNEQPEIQHRPKPAMR